MRANQHNRESSCEHGYAYSEDGIDEILSGWPWSHGAFPEEFRAYEGGASQVNAGSCNDGIYLLVENSGRDFGHFTHTSSFVMHHI